MILAVNLLYLIPALIRAEQDFVTIEVDNRPVNYSVQNAVTFVVGVICAAIPYITQPVNVFQVTLMAFSTYWLVFDFYLNARRGKRGIEILSYYGDTSDEENLSFIERNIYKQLDWRVILVAKVVLFTVAVIVYG